jgi:hypothetical protein
MQQSNLLWRPTCDINQSCGIKVTLPCYFECRFLGPNAISTWPAFSLMTDYMTDYKLKGDKTGVDELDIIEAYGGEGPYEPNSDDFMKQSAGYAEERRDRH